MIFFFNLDSVSGQQKAPFSRESVKNTSMEEEALRLIKKEKVGALGTLNPDGSILMASTPYVIHSGRIILYLSLRSAHSQNITRNSIMGFLIESSAHTHNPHALPRISLSGEIELIPKDNIALVSETYFKVFAYAKSFGHGGEQDFAFYELRLKEAQYNGGFGRALWLNPNSIMNARSD